MFNFRPRVLFADDDPDTCTLVARLLEMEGFDVIVVESSNDVLRLSALENFDVLLLDNWMPGISGLELCRQIRRSDAYIPIVFYSAAAYETDREAALLAGAQYYLAKPVPLDDLVATLRLAIAEAPCILT